MNTKFQDLIILNKPENVFIPIDDKKDYTIIPKNGEYVYKASPIAHTKGEIKENIFAPLSGKYLETIQDNCYKYLVIENDYKEMNEELRGINKDICHISYEHFISKLQESGITDNGISAYTKYENSMKKSMVIDCLLNSYDHNKYLLINYLDEALETIDAIYEINKLQNCFFIINKKDKRLIDLLEQRIGTYLSFKIITIKDSKKDKINKILAKKYRVNEDNIIKENIKNILNINNLLKYNIPFIEKYIILKYNKMAYPLKVKIGTKINYIFKSLNLDVTKYTIKTNELDLELDNQDLVVDSNINEIII